MGQKLRVVVLRLPKKKKKKKKTKNKKLMAAALDTFCPHIPKSLPPFFFRLSISHAIANHKEN